MGDRARTNGVGLGLPGHDTVNVVAKGRGTIAFRANDRPGEWMYHCHILEHHAIGMMGLFEVVR